MLSKPWSLGGVLLAAAALVACKRDCPPAPAAAPPASPAAPAHAEHAAAPVATPDAAVAPPANPVQAEMRLLSAAMETAVRGIGSGDVREIGEALHRVHAAKEATAAAISSGAWKPGKNADQVAHFVEMDEAFHGHLERLVIASQANDVPAAATAFGDAMRGCHSCHATFRP